MTRRPSALAALLAGALSVGVLPARAQETARCEAKVREVQAVVDRDAQGTRLWYWVWMAAGTGLLVGQTVIASVTTGNVQKEFIAGAATSAFIPAALLLHPPAAIDDASRLDARIALTSVDGHPGDACVLAPRAQEILAHTAADQHLTTGWFAPAFVVGGNIAVGLFLGLAFHDWAGAAKQAVGGSAVGELQLLTLPTGSLHARGLGLAGTF
jgi:hypothetical protein